MPKLRYIGEGSWVPTWPASDHEEPDEDLAIEKVESGLYEVVEESAPPKRKKRTKEVSDG